MVSWADIEGRCVLEIGAGHGALTELMAERAEQLWVVEIDPRLASELRGRFRGIGRVTVVEADVLRVDLRALVHAPVHVVASLPYESGTAIVRRLLELRGLFADVVVMLQREVCQRMLASPGSRRYGLLSIHVAMRADGVAGRVVSPGSFRPAPQVQSQILRLRPLGALRHPVGDESHFAALVRVAFAERRKMLRNTLGRWLERCVGLQGAARTFAAASIDPSQRPETVSVESFARASLESYRMLSERAGTT